MWVIRRARERRKRERREAAAEGARRTLHTGADLLTDKQQQRLQTLFDLDEHVEVEVTWAIYQRMITPTATPTGPTADS